MNQTFCQIVKLNENLTNNIIYTTICDRPAKIDHVSKYYTELYFH